MLDNINKWTWKKNSDGQWFDNEAFNTKEEAIADAQDGLHIFCHVGRLVDSKREDYLYDIVDVESFYS